MDRAALDWLRRATCGWMLVVLCGCSVGPDYSRPQVNLPPQWAEEPQAVTDAQRVDLAQWWKIFNDSELDSLIDRAALSNKDLAIAEARIREARAQVRVVTADAFPSLDTSASYTRRKASETTSSGPTTGSGGPSGGTDLFQLGFDASWELPLFSGVRRAIEAAEATMSATEESRRDVLVTLFAELARNYFELRGSQLRLNIAKENIKAQKMTLDLTRGRLEAGLASELEVAQAKAQLAATESRLPVLEASGRQSMHQIALLIGLAPGSLIEELSADAPLPASLPDLPVGVPSDILRRRPDVRQAERELAAATARIGVATSELFPSFSLTGNLGRQSIDAGDLVKPGSTFWAIGPTIRWPIFDAGRIRANIRIQDALQEQALAQYEKAVLTSLKDVESALVAYIKEQSTRVALKEAVDANRRAFDIAHELYAQGLVDFLNVLESQRSLYLSEDQLAQSDQKIATDLVALFKALGGGWDVPVS